MPGHMADSVEVWLGGGALCRNVRAQREGTISCTVPNYESNYYHVDLHVQGKGFASVQPTPLSPGIIRNSTFLASQTSSYPHVFLEGAVTSLSPSSGSILGGSELTLGGTGFSISPDRVAVMIGGVPCDITSSSHSEIRCTTGPSRSPNADTTEGVRVTVNGFPVSTMLLFTYSLGMTPVISSLSLQHTVGGENITIAGSRFGRHPQVQIVPSLDSFAGFQAGDECVVAAPSSDTEIICTLPVKPAGSYHVLVIVERQGYARADTAAGADVTYDLSVTDFSPQTGGYGGGVVLTVSGHGFPTSQQGSTDDGINITLCGIPCSVLASTLSSLTCVLSSSRPQHSSNSTLLCNLTLQHNSVTAISSQAFEFTDVLTPRLTSIAPTIGGTAGGTLVTVVGTGLLPPGVASSNQLSGADVIVTIDGVLCDWTSSTVNDTVIECRTGSHRTTLVARVEVTVRSKGKAEHEGDPVTFEYIDLWSSQFTWGGEDLPALGDSVYIKTGQTVFLDISPPELNLLLIEGALLFNDEQDLHLQAKYIFINNGTLQVRNRCSMNVLTLWRI